MTPPAKPALRAVDSRYSEAEWQTRVDLAALYRLFVKYGWTDLIYTHISARVPGEEGNYLINPYGLYFEEITASSLIKADYDGNVISPAGAEYNHAGHLIHTAVLKARPDVNFVLHTHSRAGAAVSAMKCGLLPLSQHSNIIIDQVAMHDYAQVTNDEDECERLGADLGSKFIMLMRNHGLLSCGRTAAEAFHYRYYIEMSCKIQVDVLASGKDYIVPDAAALASLAKFGAPGDEPKGGRAWPGLLRSLDRADPSYRD